MSKPRSKLRIIHETNPQKYFPALFELGADGIIDFVGVHRYSVIKEWFRAWLKDKTPLAVRTRNALRDLLFRFQLPFIENEIIVMGFAPWDWRLLFYRQLAKKNKILYHTSWHDWRENHTPRQPRPYCLKKYMKRQWHKFINDKNVKIIAVTPLVSKAIFEETGVVANVIPHSVPIEFYKAGDNRTKNLCNDVRLLYVGELSKKKGIKTLLNIMDQPLNENITLSVVGSGPLSTEVKNAGANVNYLGPIFDRKLLAEVMAEHDVLMLLSRRTKTWEELFGIVIVEAIAAGCAVIATNHIGPLGILGEGPKNGLVAEGDETSINTYLTAFTKDKNAINELKAKQQVALNYSTQFVKNQWLEAIQE